MAAAGLLMLSNSSPALAAGSMSGKTVNVGVIVDATGPAGPYGTTQKNAFVLAADDLKSGLLDAGGAAVNFDVQDSATDPAQVVQLTQKFATGDTALMIGPTLSAEAFKGDPIAVHAGLPILAISNTAQGIPEQGPCVFRDALAEEQQVPDAVALSKKEWHVKTAAIIYGDDNAFTKTDFQIFKSALDKDGIKVVDVETYHTGDVDFKPQLTKIASTKPDLLVLGALVAEAVKIIPQAKQVGITAHLIGGNGLNSPKLITIAGKDAENVVVGAAYFLGNHYPGNAGFVERYKKKFGSEPDQFAAQAYAAAQIVASLVKSGATTREELCKGMKDLKPVQTVLGPFTFLPTRDAHAPSAVLEVRNGAFAAFK
ncbi:MAG: ABC transporter substrate-binding protein [Vulcanimicrobiaceae bacterium]